MEFPHLRSSMKRNARTLLMDTTPMTVGVDSPSHALIKKKNNLQNNLTLQRKQNLVFHHVKKASEVIMNLRNWTTEV